MIMFQVRLKAYRKSHKHFCTCDIRQTGKIVFNIGHLDICLLVTKNFLKITDKDC